MMIGALTGSHGQLQEAIHPGDVLVLGVVAVGLPVAAATAFDRLVVHRSVRL